MLIESLKYSYRDVTIVPALISNIDSRSECNPFYKDGNLPIFASPMDSVVDLNMYGEYEKNNIIPIIPRTKNNPIEDRIQKCKEGVWVAVSLKEFEDYFVPLQGSINEGKVLIDIANGHMKKLYDLVKKVKQRCGDSLQIMVGNIANPETYREVVRSGADFVRLGIGAGNGCITTSNTSIHYPMASLISETYKVKRQLQASGYKKLPGIIADGGIRNYSDVIKALALGADYVMIGSLFARTIESPGEKIFNNFRGRDAEVTNFEDLHYDWDRKVWTGKLSASAPKRLRDRFIPGTIDLGEIYVKFYGMASKEGQVAMNGAKTTTSEGITKVLSVEYTIAGWIENMRDYLKSAMSYTGHRTLKEFIGGCDVVVCSPIAEGSINR